MDQGHPVPARAALSLACQMQAHWLATIKHNTKRWRFP